jgi:hypothetical protein
MMGYTTYGKLFFFGNKCPDSVKEDVKTKVEVDCEVLQDAYLGMPTKTAREITSSFKFLPEMVWKCLNSCSGRPLSRAGKEAWLKAVVQAIPNYVMSCF